MNRKVLAVSFSMVLCVLMTACSANVSPDPFAASETAQVNNLWPVYKEVVDGNKEFSETEILWPFYKTRQIPDGKMTRLWPLYYSYESLRASGGYIFPLTLFPGGSVSTLPAKEQRVIEHPDWIL